MAASGPNFTIPNNPVYDPNIPSIANGDPVNATDVVNPILQQMVNNTHANKVQTDALWQAENNLANKVAFALTRRALTPADYAYSSDSEASVIDKPAESWWKHVNFPSFVAETQTETLLAYGRKQVISYPMDVSKYVLDQMAMGWSGNLQISNVETTPVEAAGDEPAKSVTRFTVTNHNPSFPNLPNLFASYAYIVPTQIDLPASPRRDTALVMETLEVFYFGRDGWSLAFQYDPQDWIDGGYFQSGTPMGIAVWNADTQSLTFKPLEPTVAVFRLELAPGKSASSGEWVERPALGFKLFVESCNNPGLDTGGNLRFMLSWPEHQFPGVNTTYTLAFNQPVSQLDDFFMKATFHLNALGEMFGLESLDGILEGFYSRASDLLKFRIRLSDDVDLSFLPPEIAPARAISKMLPAIELGYKVSWNDNAMAWSINRMPQDLMGIADGSLIPEDMAYDAIAMIFDSLQIDEVIRTGVA